MPPGKCVVSLFVFLESFSLSYVTLHGLYKLVIFVYSWIFCGFVAIVDESLFPSVSGLGIAVHQKSIIPGNTLSGRGEILIPCGFGKTLP